MLLVVLFSSGCQKKAAQAEWWQGEQQRLELTHQLALKEYQFQQSGFSEIEVLTSLRASNQLAKARLQTLVAQRSDLTVEIEAIERQCVALKENSLRQQRHNAIGQTFEEFYSADGRKFQNASVVSIDEAGVTIRHADGSARLRYMDLNPEQRDYFGLEESASLAAVEQESREALAYERWIDRGVASVREKESRALDEQRREQQLARDERARVAAQQLVAANERPLAQPAKSFGNGYSRYYSSYRSSRPTYRYIYNYSDDCGTPRYQRSDYNNGCAIIHQGFPKSTDFSRIRSFSNTNIPYIP